jgi:hypothetical protein
MEGAKSIIVFGILGVLIAMFIVMLIPKNCNASMKEGFEDSSERMCVFNARAYSDLYPDLKKAFGYDEKKLRDHYLVWGLKEGRSPCGAENIWCKFSEELYLNKYVDVKNAGMNGLDHYKKYGIFENRSPCPPPPKAETYIAGKCPKKSKSFIDKDGNLNCCSGTVNGNTCEGTVLCTFSGSASSKYPICSTLF